MTSTKTVKAPEIDKNQTTAAQTRPYFTRVPKIEKGRGWLK